MIYTAITAGKDKIRTDITVFTDYDKFQNPRMNAKIYKVLPHLFMDTDWSIWVDGNVFLKYPAEFYLDKLKGDIGVFKHPNMYSRPKYYRDCLYMEAEVCKDLSLDNPVTINEQIARYRSEGFPEHAGLGACYLIVRRHTERMKNLNERWWAEICRGSIRDQISFPYVFSGVAEYFEEDGSYKRINHKNLSRV